MIFKRKIVKVQTSCHVAIPKEILEHLDMDGGMEVGIKVEGTKIIIEKYVPKEKRL